MSNLTSIHVTNGIPDQGTGTVSTIDNLIANIPTSPFSVQDAPTTRVAPVTVSGVDAVFFTVTMYPYDTMSIDVSVCNTNLVVEASNDGTNWFEISGFWLGANGFAPNGASFTFTQTGLYLYTIPYVQARLRGFGNFGSTTAGALLSKQTIISPFTAINGGVSSIMAGILTDPGVTPFRYSSATAESSHVITNAFTLYGIYCTNSSASVAYLMTFNTSSVPVDGTVTPQSVRIIPANGETYINHRPGPPEGYPNGNIAFCISSTGPFTKTTSPTAFFHVEYG